jgi:hypothetical protein
MTGLKLKNAIILRPHLELQQEIATWCLQNSVSYTPRQWSTRTTESLVKKTSFGQHMFRALKALGKALAAKSPSHPFEAYPYATI